MENRIEKLAEFEAILKNYHVAPSGRRVLKDSKLALLFGTSGTGRDTIINHLLGTGKYYHIVSDTTRLPRVNNSVMEQNGVEYWFRSEDEFLADLKAGKLLEAEIIHNHAAYGISIRELEKAINLNKIAITNVDLNIRAIVEEKPDTNAFLVLPPNFDEWMRRFIGRGNLPKQEIRSRLETALKVYKAGLEWPFFTFVVNHVVEDAAQAIHGRIISGSPNPKLQKEGIKVAEKLLMDTKEYLESQKY